MGLELEFVDSVALKYGFDVYCERLRSNIQYMRVRKDQTTMMGLEPATRLEPGWDQGHSADRKCYNEGEC